MPFAIDEGGDVFAPGDPPRGVCWAPADDTLELDPTWVRLDDPAGYRLANSYTIDRGRASETDRTTTGTATVSFLDLEGVLDPTNASSPFWDVPNDQTRIDPMKQASIGLQNPVTGDWFTIFRGFLAGPDHELDMWTQERGLDTISWNLVDAFDLFANVILTNGVHGDTSLTNFPNIYYPGKPSNLATRLDELVHVDDRIRALLSDAGWPSSLTTIFTGNVFVQGVVYSRKDSLLSALFDAADAEFPGIANIFVSKDGVVTFHGRYARFYPDRPDYHINHWYVGSLSDAAADPDIAPLAQTLRFYRSKDDIINACIAMPKGVDETDAGVVHYNDAASQAKYGYRSENFNDLLVYSGHNDDLTDTTAIEEANKYADYYVGNYAKPKTRCGTLRFTSRGADAIGAEAVWDLMTRVELGDVITLTTAHAGGGGFGDDFYVEHIHYSVEPGNTQMQSVTLELEVSPSGFFGYNPFGEVDSGVS